MCRIKRVCLEAECCSEPLCCCPGCPMLSLYVIKSTLPKLVMVKWKWCLVMGFMSLQPQLLKDEQVQGGMHCCLFQEWLFISWYLLANM